MTVLSIAWEYLGVNGIIWVFSPQSYPHPKNTQFVLGNQGVFAKNNKSYLQNIHTWGQDYPGLLRVN
ncbi:hypothetical protein K737_300666 [Holospora undulata HU1]|uniref:Uncharacterized protein n=2 Tax=Holospora TaxID=44747 RepID=A0A061JHK8_9PROT|nr:hypothetical protein K737_300666 [Holospora undulata HU1]GAJ46315.1 hypothetical protein HE1_00644 [Holospora elegans E1]